MTAQPMPTSSSDKIFVNPASFKLEDLPIIVLVDDLQGFIGWGIKSHTAGNYSHAMILFKPGVVASQNWLFHAVSIDEYMKPQNMLKFWRVRNLQQVEKNIIRIAIEHRLTLPWWKRRYDFLGIMGQALNIKWIQSPFGMYCSEEVNADYLGSIAETARLVKEPSPSDLDAVFKTHPELFECLGFWWED